MNRQVVGANVDTCGEVCILFFGIVWSPEQPFLRGEVCGSPHGTGEIMRTRRKNDLDRFIDQEIRNIFIINKNYLP